MMKSRSERGRRAIPLLGPEPLTLNATSAGSPPIAEAGERDYNRSSIGQVLAERR